MAAAVKKRGDFMQVLKMKGELRGFAGNDEGSVSVPKTRSGLQ